MSNDTNDLKNIKDKYGENMMHLCRTLFPTLLDKQGLLFNLLKSNFAFSKSLYDDIVNNKMEEEFKNYIYNLASSHLEQSTVITNKTPKELLKEAGYILYECSREEDIQKFKKYYAYGEKLCTFNLNRLRKWHVFFAVKENVNDIKRENFPHPMRDDEYGTSVISIQFSRGINNTLSIKNRYNNSVFNPDATFSNNLDKIIPGLTDSFEKTYNLNIKNGVNKFDLPNYIKANDGKYYKYNYKINDIYYCPNNIIIDNLKKIKTYEEKEKYLIIDYFIIDLVNKKVELYDHNIHDSFIDELNNIKNIIITKQKNTGNKNITIIKDKGSNIFIEIDKNSRIISYKNDNLTEIKDFFMYYNESIKKLILINVTKIGNFFLYNNNSIEELTFPNLIHIGSHFLYFNKVLKKITSPNLITKGILFLYNNKLVLSTKNEEKNWYISLKQQLLSLIEPKRKVKKRS